MPLDQVNYPYVEAAEKYGFVPLNHENVNYFPVDVGDIYDADHRPVPGFCRVYREDSGDTLAVHSDQYKLIKYADAFNAFDDSLRESNLDTAGLQVKTDYSHNGARVFRQYVLPEYSFEVSGKPISLRFVMWNSYDGSCSFRGLAGAFEWLCANQSYIGTSFADMRVVHKGRDRGEKIDLTIERLVKKVDEFIEFEARSENWTNIGVDAELFGKLIEKGMPQGTQGLVEHLTFKFVNELGRNASLMDVYSMMTDWATHSQTKSNQAYVQNTRQQRVARLIDSKSRRTIDGTVDPVPPSAPVVLPQP